MGLATFLPFLLKAKGATLPTVGMALLLRWRCQTC